MNDTGCTPRVIPQVRHDVDMGPGHEVILLGTLSTNYGEDIFIGGIFVCSFRAIHISRARPRGCEAGGNCFSNRIGEGVKVSSRRAHKEQTGIQT